MADATDRIADSSASGAVVPPTLEELSEEEDVFLPAGDAPGAPRRAKASGHLEDEFLHLAIRKQVSYRAGGGEMCWRRVEGEMWPNWQIRGRQSAWKLKTPIKDGNTGWKAATGMNGFHFSSFLLS
ncbi:diacylglycerol kinase zeta-like isoform X11 [Arapaima gigas]